MAKKCWALGMNPGNRAYSIWVAKRSPASWKRDLLWGGGRGLWDPVVWEVKAWGDRMAEGKLKVQWECRHDMCA